MAILSSLFCVVFIIHEVVSYAVFSNELKHCPGFLNTMWTGYIPTGKKDAGAYHKYDSPDSEILNNCVAFCCQEPSCNVILMHTNTCYWIACRTDKGCLPMLQADDNDKANPSQMVLVRPLDPSVDWQEVLDIHSNSDGLLMSNSNLEPIIVRCPPCRENEECVIGECVCKPGYTLSPNSDSCLPPSLTDFVNRSILKAQPKMIEESELQEDSRKEDSGTLQLVVSVFSKKIWLPENEATLSAFVIPEDHGKNLYSYKWEPISKPEESGRSTSEVKDNTLKLSHLTQGLYTFKVTVTGPNNASGVAVANLTVLPQSRENKPPVAVVRPRVQTVKLPNSRAVLDASGSHDDKGKLTFNWELQQGPLGYQPNITHSETLVLNNLEKPGNYTFKLTVRDEEDTSNSTDARVEVLEEPDYPPVANAGPSVVLYLPRNNITLNGSLSSDDKGITSWEWTKSPSDHDKAVDMQNTHTPFLQLSLLTEGLYTFVLKVTDEAGKFSSSETLVLVKPPTNKPPTAEAGPNITIALPRTWVQLNGSCSADDISISQWNWHQISGPNIAVFENGGNSSVTNVTRLTKGDYQFELSVVDNSGNTATDKTFVEVTQSVNVGPKADAGGDQTLVMPVDVLIVNGSKSSDDLRITSWQWTREPTSLAIGNIINHTDKSPVLMLTNIVTGRYEFRLRVTDDQGEFSEDTVSIILKQDAELMNLVELTLNIDPRQLMESQRDSVLAKLGLLLRDASQLVVRDLRPDPSTSRVSLVFYVSGPGGKAMSGPSVVSILRQSLAKDTSLLLPLSVASLRTLVCQNNCSGHGVCIQSTRACLCEAFWMEDLFNKYFGDREANCDWSILYVLIGLILLMVLVGLLAWAASCLIQSLCCPKPSQPNNKNKYSLLDSTDQIKTRFSHKMKKINRSLSDKQCASGTDRNDLVPINKVIMSEDSDDTDSDVLFESSRQPTSGRNRSKTYRNGFKPDRTSRIKT